MTNLQLATSTRDKNFIESIYLIQIESIMNSAFNRSGILNLYVVKQVEVTRFVFDCPFDALVFWSLVAKQFRNRSILPQYFDVLRCLEYYNHRSCGINLLYDRSSSSPLIEGRKVVSDSGGARFKIKDLIFVSE